MAFTENTVRQARATGKDYTLYDSHGLSLNVRAQGGKAWLFRYHWHGQQKRLSPGTYPAIDLKAARHAGTKPEPLLFRALTRTPCVSLKLHPLFSPSTEPVRSFV